jgi:hypothetical protein
MAHRLREKCRILAACAVLAILILSPCTRVDAQYLWLSAYDFSETIAARIPAPVGYERMPVESESFGAWLRYLPTKPGFTPVYLYNGEKKPNQAAHYLVLDIDVGEKDLQQCADAVIRFRAEYLYAVGRYNDLAFRFTSGHLASFRTWIDGYRAVVDMDDVGWIKFAEPDSSYANLRRYLERIFMYAGSFSLAKELRHVPNPDQMQIGDVFVEGGFPGHAVIVLDMAQNPKTGERVFLLAQSYMPAQDVHILRNPNDEELSPWYDVAFGDSLITPEWLFEAKDLRRFP